MMLGIVLVLPFFILITLVSCTYLAVQRILFEYKENKLILTKLKIDSLESKEKFKNYLHDQFELDNISREEYENVLTKMDKICQK